MPPGRDKRAKQSQFAPGRNGGQVLFEKRVMTNLTFQEPRKNKANLHRSGKCQVSSLKRQRQASILTTCDFTLHTSNFQRATGGAVCTNKPNLLYPEREGRPLAGPQVRRSSETIVRNKANFPPSETEGKYFERKGL